MESKLFVVGNEASVIYYNLNKQFCDIKKVIITKEILLSSYENDSLRELFKRLQVEDSENYSKIVADAKADGVFDGHLKSELYQTIQESLSKISGMMDVKLKDYNFMSSVSNSKFDLILRCEDFSISKRYVEKGEIIGAIKNLIFKYLSFSGNVYRTNRLENFQLEIFESEEIYKRITLKKEGSNLLLGSSFGFSYYEPIDYNIGSEFYFSIGDKFDFFKNSQTKALFRDHNKIIEKEINVQEKILSNDELIAINDKSKNINDAIIEFYINNKGALKICSLSLLENSIENKSENGFVINKSSKIYDKISILTLRDNLDEDYSNPKYLLIRNETEVKEILENLPSLKKVDGLILNFNFYHPILDKIGVVLDIDVMFFNKHLQKSLEVTLDLENFNIIGSQVSEKSSVNPFSNIIQGEAKKRDEFLEKLKNIDLNEGISSRGQSQTNSNVNNYNHTEDVGRIAQSIMSSQNSSINQNGGKSNMNWGHESSNNKKKSAMDFLVDMAKDHEINKKEREFNKKQEFIDATKPKFEERSFIQVKEEYRDVNVNSAQNNYNNNNFFDPNNFSDNNTGVANVNNSNLSFSVSDVFDQKPSQNSNIKIGDNLSVLDYDKPKIDTKKYEGILATNIITIPGVGSGKYFVDVNTISETGGGELFFLATNPHDIQNSNLNYILPIELNSSSVKDCYLLLNSANDYFLINDEQDVKYFLNLSKINSLIKEKILDESIKRLKNISVIIVKEDLELIEKHINRIENIFIKDVSTNDDYNLFKNKILGFEKKFLMNFN